MKITEENFQSIEIIESFHETKNNVQHIGSPAHQARGLLSHVFSNSASWQNSALDNGYCVTHGVFQKDSREALHSTV